MLFFDSHNITLSCYFRCHRAGSQLKMSERQTKAGNLEVFNCFLTFSNVTYSHSHSHSLYLSRYLTISLFQSLIESLLTCWTTFVFISMLKSHSHTHALTLTHSHSHTLSHSDTLTISHSITLDMLNKFCFYLYAQKSLFIAEKCNAFFDIIIIITLSCEFRVHWPGSQLKIEALPETTKYFKVVEVLQRRLAHSLFCGQSYLRHSCK